MFDTLTGVLAMLLDGVWIENLLRFPVEKRARPSYEMMCDLAPDSRMIPAIAEALEVEGIDPDRASRTAIDAQQEDPLNSYALGRRANHHLNASARAAMDAHRLCEIAAGKCRALTLAEMGEFWVPFDAQEAGAWLVEAANRAVTRQTAGKG
jgi:hypothetical protein